MRRKKDMQRENAINKELLSHLAMLEAKHQNQVLAFVKELLNKKELLNEKSEMNLRAAASENDIAYGQVKSGSAFKKDFEAWQKKKRTDLK
jgi:hypothetical protein